ncbi:MAG: UDP-N-acetylmuramoyl-L-alanyl-D-glutamate--2,6-diaminopimelate ligase [Bacillota bacterium]
MLFSELIADQTIVFRQGNLEVPVRGIAYDSRKTAPGDVFVAIEGFQTDGHYYVDQAVANGAAALVVRKPVAVPASVPLVQVPDTRLALALISARFYGYPGRRLKLIGVTGTNGKTTTTYLLKAIFQHAGARVGLIGTIANWIGECKLPVQHTTPESLDLQKLLAEMVSAGVDTVVMEVSSHALALHRVAGCPFDTGVFTNITRDHLDFHKDMDDYLAAKKILFQMAGKFAVINGDDPAAPELRRAARGKVITYGIRQAADVAAADVRVRPKGASFEVRTPWGAAPVNLKLTGYFNVYNALAALAAGAAAGLPLAAMVKALEEVAGVPGRFELVDRGQDFTVVVDYAHTPDGLENILRTARQLPHVRLITVFGCGGDRDRGKRPRMGEIAARLSDLVVVTSDNPRTEDPSRIIADIEEGVRRARRPGDYVVLPDRRRAIAYAVNAAARGDIVIIAGKGHEDYQIIGTEKFPFDDREEAAKALAERFSGEN